MISKTSPGLRVGIVRNYSTESKWGMEMIDSITELVLKNDPGAHVEVFQPIEGGHLPDATALDLVVLTGGVFDLTAPVWDPWVQKTINWLRDVEANHPGTKVLGICWGHQVVSVAMGGKLAVREGGTLIDVENIPLTAEGQKFFQGGETIRLHKFHKRIVAQTPTSFSPLAERAEILMSQSGQFLTFQGHPEMTAHISQQLVDKGDGSYLSDPSAEGVAKLHKALEAQHDGEKAFARIIQWAQSS